MNIVIHLLSIKDYRKKIQFTFTVLFNTRKIVNLLHEKKIF